MGITSIDQMNQKIKHILLMNWDELRKEFDILSGMEQSLKILMKPTETNHEELESKILSIIVLYVTRKIGEIDQKTMDFILEHKHSFIAIITANAIIGGVLLGELHHDHRLHRKEDSIE